MNKMIKLIGLAASLAVVSGVAMAKDTSALSKVSPVEDMQYPYQKGNPNAGRIEQARYNEDRMIRATEVLNSNLSLDLKRLAVDELVANPSSGSTRALAAAQKQAQAMRNPEAEAYVADAIWKHAAQLQFRNKEANALMYSLAKSSNREVRSIGLLGAHDAALNLKRNAE